MATTSDKPYIWGAAAAAQMIGLSEGSAIRPQPWRPHRA